MHPSIQQILIKQLLCANHTVTDWAGRRGKGGNADGCHCIVVRIQSGAQEQHWSFKRVFIIGNK